MVEPLAKLTCQACGHEAAASAPLPFRCPAQVPGDDADHLMVVRWSAAPADADLRQDNPFIAFRGRSLAHARWLEHGRSDGEFVDLVRELDAEVARVAGHGFRITPWADNAVLGARYKDETGNVAGSHKARHLFGLALWIEVAERTGLVETGVLGSATRPLAIASCGNAALAAAVVARGWGRRLRVFIPDWADDEVVRELREHGAEIVVCTRQPNSPPGDPCVHAFRAAVEAGALPFTCQGPENGLTIEGGMTLGFEIAQALDAPDAQALDHLFLQIGGGALASSTCAALERMGVLPKVHAVQTEGCPPIALAWRALTRDLKVALGASDDEHFVGDDPGLAHWLAERADSPEARRCFEAAVHQRSRYMRPVDSPAASIATGILDDETYDWFAVVRAMIVSGGWPLVVNEEDLLAARDSAREATGVNVDATGAAGLAGLQRARAQGQLPASETAAVLLTGIQR